MRLPIFKDKEGGWKQWFAWRPVVVGDYLVWLETIERWPRIGSWFLGDYEYREI